LMLLARPVAKGEGQGAAKLLCHPLTTSKFLSVLVFYFDMFFLPGARFLPGAAAPDSNDGTDVAYRPTA